MSLRHPNPRSSIARLLQLALAWIAAVHALPALAIDDWRTFESSGGRFSVAMPSEPVEKIKKKWFPISSFVSHVYTAYTGDDAFGVNHTDLPGFAMLFASTAKIFDSTREGFLEDSNAEEVSFDEIEVLGRPARELIYSIPANDERPPLHGIARMFFEGKRLYVFWTEVTVTRSPADLVRYFDSIEIR